MDNIGMIGKMEKKFQQKNIFESGFDSFEFDDGFLLKIDADLKKNSSNKKDFGNIKKINAKEVEKSCVKVKENYINEKKSAKYYDLPLFIEDLNESDFFDFSKTKSQSAKTKADGGNKDKKEKKQLTRNTYTNCVSPILSCKSFNKNIISSSTPLKPSDSLTSKEVQKNSEEEFNNTPKNSQFDYLEADLFDDWNLDEINNPITERETVTLSQALKLIEEAKSAEQRESKEVVPLNESIDLLTGEIVNADVKNLFAQPFDSLNSVEKKQDTQGKDSSSDSVVIIADNVKCKPSAAQKLNFDTKNYCFNADEKKKNFGNVYFSSDDDLDFLIQGLPGKTKKNQKFSNPDRGAPSLKNTNTESEKVLKNCDWNESSESVVQMKRRKSFNVIDSDTSDDNSSPKFQRKKKTRKHRNFLDDSGKEFLDFEAEVSEEADVSSDEVEEEGEYERSFVDEESYLSQNLSADMTAKYLQSVKGLARPGTFKIPAAKPYIPENVFSQIPEDNNTDYQIDSFCVNEVEEDVKTDLSDLEIAEKILEMDQRKRKKRCQKSRKIK